MEREFLTRTDWFENGIRPALLRRTAIGAMIIAGCIIWWFIVKTWIPVVVVLFVVAERAFELVSIPSTKKLIASMRVTASETGLMFYGDRIKGGVHYPWSSLRASLKRERDGSVSSIQIQDTTRKGSKLRLVGYQAMDELGDLIRQYAQES